MDVRFRDISNSITVHSVLLLNNRKVKRKERGDERGGESLARLGSIERKLNHIIIRISLRAPVRAR